ACRHLPCMDELVEARDAKDNAERLDRPSRGVAHHRDYQARIHAARKEGPQRHVGDHASLYRSPKRDLTSLEPLLLVTGLAVCIVERPVTTASHSLRPRLHEARCRELLDCRVNAPVLRDEVEIEELVDRTGIDREAISGGEPDALDVAREVEPVAKIRIEERLLPQPVPRKEQPLARSIPESESEHPVQAGVEEPLRSPFLVRMNDDLGVGPRSEAMPGSPELVSQVIEVVDLPVEDDPDRPVLVAHGLVAGRRAVDDAEPPVGKPDARRRPDPAIVGTACQHDIAHPFQHGRLGAVPRAIEDSCDPTHGGPSPLHETPSVAADPTTLESPALSGRTTAGPRPTPRCDRDPTPRPPGSAQAP